VQPITNPVPDIAIDVLPVSGRIGGEVQGVRLGADLDEAIVAALKLALNRHKVLFFRDQHHLDDAAHQAFGRRWGQPTIHPTAPAQVGDFLLELDSRHGGKANVWHTDLTFMASYPSASILRAVTIPPAGGDTVWANTVEAYERLPDPLRVLADTLRAVHSNDYDYAANQTEPEEGTDRYQAEFISTVYEAEHPLVRVHPETGERALVLGAFFKQFVGLGTSESRRLYATQHYAIDDYGDAKRVVRRVTIEGDATIGIDGRSGRQIRPEKLPDLRAV